MKYLLDESGSNVYFYDGTKVILVASFKYEHIAAKCVDLLNLFAQVDEAPLCTCAFGITCERCSALS